MYSIIKNVLYNNKKLKKKLKKRSFSGPKKNKFPKGFLVGNGYDIKKKKIKKIKKKQNFLPYPSSYIYSISDIVCNVLRLVRSGAHV